MICGNNKKISFFIIFVKIGLRNSLGGAIIKTPDLIIFYIGDDRSGGSI